LGYWITGNRCVVELDFACKGFGSYRNVEVAVGICRLDESRVLYLGTKVKRQDFDVVSGVGTFRCTVPTLPLEPGQYFLITEVKQNGIIVDHVRRAAKLRVAEGDYYGTGVIWPYGGFLCDYDWSIDTSPS
jgi:hypothetical protein